mgnify:CR=1 FL=1
MNTDAIQQCNLFHTPDSFKEVSDWIELHAPEERIHLYTAAHMTMNLCAQIIKQEKEETHD